jgi:Ribonuclease G/E
MIDFLRMKSKREQGILTDALDRFINDRDPCTVQIHGLTKLGLMEISRQRRTPPLLERYESVVGG